LFAVLTAGCLAATTISFYDRQDTAVAGRNDSIVAGDFNGDGREDIVSFCTNQLYTPYVEILLSNGDGSFHQAQTFQPSGTPTAVSTADFNGDGKLDFALASYGQVAIYLGNGDGTFQPPLVGLTGGCAAGEYATCNRMAVADLNHDGKIDLAVTSTDLQTLSIAFGNGDGTFQTPVTYSIPASIGFIVAKDLNGDGSPDLVMSNGSAGTISVLLNHGDGTFGAPLTYPGGGGSAGSISIADVNKDGKLDLVVAAGNPELLLGNGDGTFGPPQQTVSLKKSTSSAIVSDFNHDGNPDIVASTSNGPVLLVGDGTGGFTELSTLIAGKDPAGLLGADVSGNGLGDLVVADDSVFPGFSTWLGTRSRYDAAPQTPAGPGACALAKGDWNGDGNLDLAETDSASNSVRLSFGSGLGTFPKIETLAVGADPCGIVTADFNGDGIPDLATANQSANTVSVLIGLGGGLFLPAVNYPVGSLPTAILTGDFYGDGHTDILVNSSTSNVVLLRGKGDGTFRAMRTVPLSAPAQALAVSDFNHDRKLDFAATFGRNGGTTVYLGKGNGTFTPAPQTLSGNFVGVYSADLNHDGNADLVVLFDPQGTADVFLGKGDGTFQPGVTYGALYLSNYVVIADLNNDGYPDLVISSSDSNALDVLLGNGDGSFMPAQTFGTGFSPVSVIAGHFRGADGPDLITVNTGTDTLSYLNAIK
jgi:hypothetical protein